MELKGTVLNVVPFGAFVDVGLKDSGLVHISQMANRYIKSPHEVVAVGDVVTVWVLNVDADRKRASLTMIPPGTERKPPERRPQRRRTATRRAAARPVAAPAGRRGAVRDRRSGATDGRPAGPGAPAGRAERPMHPRGRRGSCRSANRPSPGRCRT